MKRWLGIVAAIIVGVRAAMLWRDINEANATRRAIDSYMSGFGQRLHEHVELIDALR